jgi:hypothetical protein
MPGANTTPRRCQCGCGATIPQHARPDKVFFSNTCRANFCRRNRRSAQQAPDLVLSLAQAIGERRKLRGQPALAADARLHAEAEAEALRLAHEAQQEGLAQIPPGPYGQNLRLFSSVLDEEQLAAVGAATLADLDASHLGLAVIPIPAQPGRYAVALAAAGPSAPTLEDSCQTA